MAPPYSQQGKFEDEGKAKDTHTAWWRAQSLGGPDEQFTILAKIPT